MVERSALTEKNWTLRKTLKLLLCRWVLGHLFSLGKLAFVSSGCRVSQLLFGIGAFDLCFCKPTLLEVDKKQYEHEISNVKSIYLTVKLYDWYFVFKRWSSSPKVSAKLDEGTRHRARAWPATAPMNAFWSRGSREISIWSSMEVKLKIKFWRRKNKDTFFLIFVSVCVRMLFEATFWFVAWTPISSWNDDDAVDPYWEPNEQWRCNITNLRHPCGLRDDISDSNERSHIFGKAFDTTSWLESFRRSWPWSFASLPSIDQSHRGIIRKWKDKY